MYHLNDIVWLFFEKVQKNRSHSRFGGGCKKKIVPHHTKTWLGMHDTRFVTALFGFNKVSAIKDPSKTNGTINIHFFDMKHHVERFLVSLLFS